MFLNAIVKSPARQRVAWNIQMTMRTRLPVRSAIYKHRTGGLVVRWVTTGESPLLYVFAVVSAFLNMILAYI
ncbi:hypothetical protein HBI81_192480 [Parastagonospora nodorum]|nr:hypothetical protein HBI03_220270 [Parastagonospora nodorum]KAH4262718.1 hypothetical protein HBI04_195800 [Parastagonospora nodorum]KAH4910364.1 hypothetical protein HBI80_035150 [Parastagonospora nodorum]KAH5251888.1 hypothetical protein HBI70_204920 [Parastagonospora nodorum]KAH6025420.1 hypothetical protein HBI82_066900 [Parastagonospora nodorum]